MSWQKDALDRLAGMLPCGYHPGGPPATEPTALAALALTVHDRPNDAARGLTWLAELQVKEGKLGVTATEASPSWPTCQATMAWLAYSGKLGEANAEFDFRGAVGRAIGWIIETKGETLPRVPEMGHNSMLVGWPWVLGTHSWIEPTAWAVLALKTAGRSNHPRTREAVRLLIDRLLPSGGCNYGNTLVLGQELLPHLQSTGLTMVALAGDTGHDADGKVTRSIDYVEQELNAGTATASLCYGLLGLAAHGRSMPNADTWLGASYAKAVSRDLSGLKLALLTLAAQRDKSPLLPGSRT